MNTPIHPHLTRKVHTLGAVIVFFTMVFITMTGFKTNPMNPGVVFEVETTHHFANSAKTETSIMSIDGPHLLKIEILPGKDQKTQVKDEVIFRGDRRQMVAVNHSDQSYFTIDDKMLSSMGNQMKEVQNMMKDINIPKEVLAQMPEAERKKLEAMLNNKTAGAGGVPGGGQSSPKEINNTGERAKKEGYPCVKYVVLQDGKKLRELWVTNWNNVEGGDEAEEVLKEMAKFFQELKKSMGEMLGGEGPLGGSNSFFEEFEKIDGFPVVTHDFDEDGSLEGESILRSAKRQDLDPDAFEPPSGYKLMTMGPR